MDSYEGMHDLTLSELCLELQSRRLLPMNISFIDHDGRPIGKHVFAYVHVHISYVYKCTCLTIRCV